MLLLGHAMQQRDKKPLCSLDWERSLWFSRLAFYTAGGQFVQGTLARIRIPIAKEGGAGCAFVFLCIPILRGCIYRSTASSYFEVWVKKICVPHVSIWGFQNRVSLSLCPSVCPYPEKRNHPSFVNISPPLVIDTSIINGKVFTSTTGWNLIFFRKFEIEFWLVYRLVLKSWNHLIFSISVPH